MTVRGPVLTLNNGVEMPAIGLGVFQTPPDETTAAVEAALGAGYRHVDTAAAYGNEREVGEGIRRSGLARDEVFIETKVWISDYGYDETLHAWEKSAGKLGVERIDLLLLHQALPSAFDRTLSAYRALEKLLADRRVRAIGVSNFMPEHLDRLLGEASVVPAVNQIEVYPYFQQPEVQRVDAGHGILTQAWSPIGGITSYRGGKRSTFDDPTLREIAATHDKTPAQVMLRWHLDEGRSAIPKSVRLERIAENFAIFDFALSAEERSAIDALNLPADEVEPVLRQQGEALARLIHGQMQSHYHEGADEGYEATVHRGWTEIRPSAYTAVEGEPPRDFRQAPPDLSNIGRYIFGGFSRCLYPVQKFHSNPERILAVILEREAVRWFRPVPGQFQIRYRRGADHPEYIPDFVAELTDRIVMFEVKAKNETSDPEVKAKAEAARAWCAHATDYAQSHGGKPWFYVVIPHDLVSENMFVDGLLQRAMVSIAAAPA